MSWSPTPNWIQRWNPQKWSEVVGNAEIVQVWKNFLANGPCNTLITGPSRSGKTRTIMLGIRALICTNRTPSFDPCGQCLSCKALRDGRSPHNGIFKAISGSEYSFHPIDCENVTPEELQALRNDGQLDDDKVIIYLDEVAALRQRRLEGKILKLIDETHATWIASAISLTRTKGARKGEWTERLSKPMKGRFAIKEGTSAPHQDDLYQWIVARSLEWNITILDQAVTIPAMMKRTQCRVGFLIHMFTKAATWTNRTIGPDDVDRFNLDSTD